MEEKRARHGTKKEPYTEKMVRQQYGTMKAGKLKLRNGIKKENFIETMVLLG